MDDYIRKILSRQRFREETASEVLLKKQQYLAQESPEGAALRKEQEKEKTTGVASADKREAALWALLKGMESLSTAAFRKTEESRQDEARSWHVPESLSRFSGTVFGQEHRQLTPEGLSMFYQRDARRFS